MYSEYGLVLVKGEGGVPYVAVHRVFYTLQDVPYAISTYPCGLFFDDPEEAAEVMNYLAEQAADGNVIEYESLPKIESEYGEGVIDFPHSETTPEQNAPSSYSLN